MASSAGAAAEGLLRCVYEGCIAGCDTGIERRPYHRNCGCALHNKSRKGSSNITAFSAKCCKKSVSYPIRRSWSEGSLALHASASSSSHSSPSSSPAPVVAAAAARREASSGYICSLNDDHHYV
ncbi:uncharacterized protein LOC122297052 [Carya illinoinensis]|uniref:Uncharacterized protein n=1 Tax=Carya illinoinensis TaxID=32201 RepID=A0A8T1NGU0_CARIL|nr:uncharacterized protein LOC122297052 [Carya illinoinensis]KAG6628147.1 hypothetical protein CIPAW_15G181400 [Carya illinoinensis]KAG6676714.1 hypothetical protein I3842_15G165200 [Carya illinoinensis]